MRRWMSRLSYSFLIIAGVMGYQAFEIFDGRSETAVRWQGMLFTIIAVISLGLGLLGLRIRNEEIRGKP